MKLRELYAQGHSARRAGCSVLSLTREGGDAPGLRVRARSADVFNFVFRQTLLLDGEDVTEARCTCGRAPCEHLAAVAALLLGEAPADAAPAPSVQPVPERESAPPPPEPEPAPAPPQPEPEPEPAPDPDAPKRSMRIRLGERAEDGEAVWWMPNDTEQLFHVNTGIIGTMGTGKTQCTKSIIAQLSRARGDNYDGSPLGLLVFDYKGDYNETKPEFVRAVDARVYKPWKLPFNPLALIRGRSFKPLLPVHTANQFIDTLTRIYRLGAKQQATLMQCIMEAYHAAGIREDNEATWGRTAPTVASVYERFAALGDRAADSLTAALEKLSKFCIFEPEPAAARPLAEVLRGVAVLDLSQYDSDIQSLVVAITLDLLYAQMQALGSSATDGRYRCLRYLVLVDEADEFMSRGFPSLRRILKEGRECGVGVLLSTQSLTHFAASAEDYSRYVLTWLVHNVSDLKPRDVEYLFKLPPHSAESERVCGAIRSAQKHESLLKLGGGAPEKLRDLPFFRLPEE